MGSTQARLALARSGAPGLGGGSLINAGVMEFPRDQVFDDAAWPAALRTNRQALRERAQLLRRELGAADANQQPNAVERGTLSARSAEGWSLEVWHTDAALRRRMAGPLRLSARRVILAGARWAPPRS